MHNICFDFPNSSPDFHTCDTIQDPKRQYKYLFQIHGQKEMMDEDIGSINRIWFYNLKMWSSDFKFIC